jgi:threonine synthase
MAKLICKECKKEYSTDEKIWKCECGGLLDIDFKASFPLDKIKKRKPTMWRYREAIPINKDENIVSFDEGFTPLLEVGFNGKVVLIKQDQLFPTSSFKDRGASVLVSKAKELSIKKVVEDSSGNAGCAIAAYCAKAHIDCEIFVPADTSPAKIIQIKSYGAKINKVIGSREDAASAALKAAQKDYYASHSWNPFFLHGTKTFAFEICEQLGWKSPDTVILPVGNGTLLLGSFIGFNELQKAGIIKTIPRIIAIQSENCNPLYKAFKENLNEIPKIDKKDSLAEGISIAEPIRGKEILSAVRKSRGDFIVVNDKEIKESLIEMCNKGFYIEPTSASTIAGIKKYLQKSNSNELIISVFTGHGLKTTEKILKIFTE